MNIKQHIKNFIAKYSAKSIIERLDKLILNVRESLKNTGNSFYKLLLICLLLILIFAKRSLLIMKDFWNFLVKIWKIISKFFNDLFNTVIEFIKLAYQFFRKVIILALIEEIGFYYKKLRDLSLELKENLTQIVDKLSEYSEYLSNKIDDKNISFNPKNSTTYLTLYGYSFFYLLYTIIWIIVSIIMTIVLIFTTLIVFPVLHQYIRKKLFNIKDDYST